MAIKGVHRRGIGGVGAEADETVRPHQDSAVARDASRRGIELRGRGIDDRNKLVPPRTQTAEALAVLIYRYCSIGASPTVT
jgi:hypothetical protein